MNVKLILAGFAALCMLSSCIKESDGGQSPNPPGAAQDARAGIRLRVHGEPTDPLRGETVKTIDVLVFDANSTLEEVMSCTPGDAVNGEFPLELKPGQKTFFAVLNNPAADAMGHISWSVGATTLDDFRKSSFEAARGNAQGIGPDLSVYKDGVFMMLSDGKEVLLESDQFLRVELSCDRLGSKGQMLWKDIQLSPSFVDNDINPRNDDIADNDGDPVSKVKDHLSLDQTAGFQLMNVQGTMWVAAPAAPAEDAPLGALLPWADSYGNGWLPARTDNYTTALNESSYATENIVPSNPKKNQVTCMLVKAQALWDGQKPGALYAIIKFTDAAKSYRHVEEYLGVYNNKAEAEKKLAQLQGNAALKDLVDIREYTDGIVYYRVDLLDWEKVEPGKDMQGAASIRRNSFYQVKIGDILNLGWNNPADLVDPEDDRPVSNPWVDVQATITVADWVTIDQEGEIG